MSSQTPPTLAYINVRLTIHNTLGKYFLVMTSRKDWVTGTWWVIGSLVEGLTGSLMVGLAVFEDDIVFWEGDRNDRVGQTIRTLTRHNEPTILWLLGSCLQTRKIVRVARKLLIPATIVCSGSCAYPQHQSMPALIVSYLSTE
jgi:hypothetical protein